MGALFIFSSWCRHSESVTTPCFAAQYAEPAGTERSPAADDVFTICAGLPCRIILGTKAWTPWTTPIRLTPISHCQSSGVVSQIQPPEATPALLKSSATSGASRYASSASPATSSGRETSTRSLKVSGRANKAAVAPRLSSSTSASSTRMPRRAQAIASERPSPLPPPVTTAMRPAKSSMVSAPRTFAGESRARF